MLRCVYLQPGDRGDAEGDGIGDRRCHRLRRMGYGCGHCETEKHLFRGMLSDYYRIYDSEAFRICEAAENEATRNSGKEDFIFWKTMYALNQKIKDFIWKGRLYAGLPAMGRDLLEHLKKNDTSMNDFMDSVFNQSIMSQLSIARGNFIRTVRFFF